MNILIACEFSGIVRDAFLKKGHNAISCDLLPTEKPGPHIQGDVRAILDDGWDMMIAFPPCTYLSNTGNRWFSEERYGIEAKKRKQKRVIAAQFVIYLWESKIPKICIENPVGWLNGKHPNGSLRFRKPDQVLNPYQFGDKELKRTCLWLRNLQPLQIDWPPHPKPKPKYYLKKGVKMGQAVHFCESIGSRKGRAKIRSRTFPGVAKAMSEQWG